MNESIGLDFRNLTRPNLNHRRRTKNLWITKRVRSSTKSIKILSRRNQKIRWYGYFNFYFPNPLLLYNINSKLANTDQLLDLPRYSDKYRPSPAAQPNLKRKDLHQPFFPSEIFEDYFNPKRKKRGTYIHPFNHSVNIKARITLTSTNIIFHLVYLRLIQKRKNQSRK